jgi:hypothetical protein
VVPGRAVYRVIARRHPGTFCGELQSLAFFLLNQFSGDHARISLSSASRRYIAIPMDNSDMRFMIEIQSQRKGRQIAAPRRLLCRP